MPHRTSSGISLLVRAHILCLVYFYPTIERVHWSLYPIGYEQRKFPDDATKELLGTLLSSSIGDSFLPFSQTR